MRGRYPEAPILGVDSVAGLASKTDEVEVFSFMSDAAGIEDGVVRRIPDKCEGAQIQASMNRGRKAVRPDQRNY